MSSDQQIIELHDLLDRLVENNLSFEQKKRLSFLLEHNDEARLHYVRFMNMSSSLMHYAEELVSDDFGEDSKEVNKTGIFPFVRYLIPLAALLIAAFLLFFQYTPSLSLNEQKGWSKSLSANSSPEVIKISDAVALLTEKVGLEWSKDAGFRPELGNAFEPGSLIIENGLAQVEFLQGSNVILEGPVHFDVVGPNEGSLMEGKLRANVPRLAQGFTVNLPKGKIIDLGTEFGLNVHPGGSTEVVVYEGKVIYEGQADEDELVSHEVAGGEALFIDPYGNPNRMEVPSQSYLGAADLAFRSMEKSHIRYLEWVELSKEIANGPHTLAYYNFNDHNSWTRTLREEANNGNVIADGAIVGCKWSEGRWSGKGALGFERKSDCVRMNLAKNLTSMTLSVWIKIDSLDTNIAPVLFSSSSTRGAVGWFINQEGKVVLQVRKKNGYERYVSAVAFRKERFGRWTHMATTFDSTTKMISHYVNGRPFSREKINTVGKLNIGSSTLGHSAISVSKSSGRVALSGKIDEFALFEKSFDELEVRRIYEIGCPYEATNLFGPNLP